MKYNYDLDFQKIIKSQSGKSTLLLHSCCAPCSSSVLDTLKGYFDITVIYYNPNIHPKQEYEKRKAEQIKLLKILDIKFMDCDYNSDEFYSFVSGLENEKEGGARCVKCFELRLDKTANLAKLNNFDYFGTTLTVSPHKNEQIINSIGKFLQEKYNINYLFSDFKKHDGYLKSIRLSKDMDLYRQDYCGCSFSLKERYSQIDN